MTEDVTTNLNRLNELNDRRLSAFEASEFRRTTVELARTQAALTRARRKARQCDRSEELEGTKAALHLANQRYNAARASHEQAQAHLDVLTAGIKIVEEKLARLRAVISANRHLPGHTPVTPYTATASGATHKSHPRLGNRDAFDHQDLRELNDAWAKCLAGIALPVSPPSVGSIINPANPIRPLTPAEMAQAKQESGA